MSGTAPGAQTQLVEAIVLLSRQGYLFRKLHPDAQLQVVIMQHDAPVLMHRNCIPALRHSATQGLPAMQRYTGCIWYRPANQLGVPQGCVHGVHVQQPPVRNTDQLAPHHHTARCSGREKAAVCLVLVACCSLVHLGACQAVRRGANVSAKRTDGMRARCSSGGQQRLHQTHPESVCAPIIGCFNRTRAL